MKSLILTMFLGLSLACFSQDSYTYFTMSGGLSRPANHPVFSLTGGYQFDNGLFTEGSMRVVATRKIGNAVYNPKLTPENPVHFGVLVGYSIPISSWFVSPVIGGHYRLVSTDLRRLNGWDYSAGLRATKGMFMAEFTQIGKYSQATIGMYLPINN